jgi:pSer/pThr/pTyr-binding forkhead associated (FHA) protein
LAAGVFDTEIPMLDVNLSYFRASAKGVSRRHIMITRKGQMAYIIDLNTRNGTWLNNQPLVSNNARILRNNDHLRLGQLHICILFGKITAQLEVMTATNTFATSF